jgi:hypothetical protein
MGTLQTQTQRKKPVLGSRPGDQPPLKFPSGGYDPALIFMNFARGT